MVNKSCLRFVPLLAATVITASAPAQQPQPASQPILSYIKMSWKTLTRSHQTLAQAAEDPKFKPAADGRWPVYLPAGEDLNQIAAQLRKEMQASQFAKIQLRRLPVDLGTLKDQGLLYLPRPYVVPGGRFNEMYGWDSFFIQLGLLRDREVPLAKDMTDNFLYQIRNYGRILNANRTYYLTRSQPPFLTEMILGVYRKTQGRKWLESTLPEIEKTYRLWTTEPHLTPETGLSRYWDFGDGPAPEVLSSERDEQGLSHYDRIRQFYKTNKVTDYDLSEYYDPRRDVLTGLFYKGDRSMRESGFDPSNRFGQFNVDVLHYNPVCLNSLLYRMEVETAEILNALGRQKDAAAWETRAASRAKRMNELMWDATAGLYFDYEFVHKRLRKYPFLTTFYPLWTGIASKEQAAAVVKNLQLFERGGGLLTSTQESGNQWDAPFGWAPLELIAVEGLRKYGYSEDANRIAAKFLGLISSQYARTGTIVEKYDVDKSSSNVSSEIRFGYRSNEIGFGWTNAAFVVLLDHLPAPAREKVLAAGR